MADASQLGTDGHKRERPRQCLRCGAEITACFGFSLARDIVSGRRPVREHCGKCAEIITLMTCKDRREYFNVID
jgi:hypothetical protein